jgi:division protein CdvB (Snf7/Vps24/ESCRT-III family)
MSNKPLSISESAAVQMPMKTVASLIIIVALGTMGYFQIIERLNIADTKIKIMEQDVDQNTEFRIKWPRGQMGSLPADSEQYMMLEDLYKTTDRINKHIEDMALNKVNIEFLSKQMDKVLVDIEKLKDSNRDMKYNGNGKNY